MTDISECMDKENIKLKSGCNLKNVSEVPTTNSKS